MNFPPRCLSKHLPSPHCLRVLAKLHQHNEIEIGRGNGDWLTEEMAVASTLSSHRPLRLEALKMAPRHQLGGGREGVSAWDSPNACQVVFCCALLVHSLNYYIRSSAAISYFHLLDIKPCTYDAEHNQAEQKREERK